MHVYAPDADVKNRKTSDCGCGGRCGCESRCCDLECLVRPNFFCGQLLTDGDLAATIEWARNRLSLTRYRHGWGVVCGLDVTCSSPGGRDNCCDEPRAPTVWVNPGYAIDCCGNDLVVCEPMPVDLTDACKPEDDPCERPEKPTKRDERAEAARAAEEEGQLDCWEALGSRRGLVAVTLMLRYHEDLSQPQPAMFRSGCSGAGGCEYTRVLEHPCVHVEPVGLDRDCEEDEAGGWREQFDDNSRAARQAIVEAARLGMRGLLRYLRKHPPYKFCFLEDLVCCLMDAQGPDEAGKRAEPDLRRVSFLLYFDWLLHQLSCECPSCRPDKGVPLARVILRRPEPGSAASCRVLFIDDALPYRRPLRRDGCRPVPRGTIDLAPYLWHPERVVIDRLGALGVQVETGTKLDYKDQYAEYDRGTVLLETRTGQRLRTLSMADPLACRRVVGFQVVQEG